MAVERNPTTLYHDMTFDEAEECPQSDCSRLFIRVSNLMNHLAYEHHLDRFYREFQLILDASEPVEQGGQFSCAVCERKTNFRSSMILHLATPHAASLRYLSYEQRDTVARLRRALKKEKSQVVERKKKVSASMVKREEKRKKILAENPNVKRSRRLRGEHVEVEAEVKPMDAWEDCPKCQKSYRRPGMRGHFANIHFMSQLSAKKRALSGLDNEETFCPLCAMEFDTLRSVATHLGTAHNFIMECTEDEKVKALLAIPVMEDHFLCPCCLKDLKTKRFLVRHLVMAHYKDEVMQTMGTGTEDGKRLRPCPYAPACRKKYYYALPNIVHVGEEHGMLFKFLPEDAKKKLGEIGIACRPPSEAVMARIKEGFKPKPKKSKDDVEDNLVLVKEEPGWHGDDFEEETHDFAYDYGESYNDEDQYAPPMEEEDMEGEGGAIDSPFVGVSEEVAEGDADYDAEANPLNMYGDPMNM